MQKYNINITIIQIVESQFCRKIISKVDNNDGKLIWEDKSIETRYLFHFVNNLQWLIINRINHY